MPAPVTPWVTETFPTAKSLNLACYTCDGTGDNPNGVAFHARRPILYETWTRAGGTFPSAPGGVRTVMSSSGATTSGLVVYDTAGYYGQTQDQPGNGYYQYLAAVKGSSGDGLTAGGWVLVSHFAAVKAGATLTSVSADLTAPTVTPVSGTRQATPHTLDNCAFFLDLVSVGGLTWSPALTVYDTASAAASIATSTDASGETCRLCAIWAAVSAASTGQATFTTPGTYPWTAPPGVTTVTVAATGGGGGGGGGDASGGGVAYGGGGGGGGANSQGPVGVTPSNSYVVTVGAGGLGGAATLAGVSGAASVFPGDSANVTAHGGAGGGAGTASADGAGGGGGAGTFAGGSGNAGTTGSSGGGGGSSAGTSQAGANATDGNGAPAPAGGGPGGGGGKAAITVVQTCSGTSTGSTTVTATFAAAVQAGNAVLVFSTYQGKNPSQDPTAKLDDGTTLNQAVTADNTNLQVALQVGLNYAAGLAGGEKTVTATAYGSDSTVMSFLIQCYEVAGLGPNPTVDQSPSHIQGGPHPADDDYQSSGAPGPTTTGAPELWVGCTGAQQTFSFVTNSPNAGWAGTQRLGANHGGVWGAMLTAYQVATATGDIRIVGTFNKNVQKGTFACSFTTDQATAGAAPVVAPGGGGGGGLGSASGGGSGAAGQVTLTWTGASGSGYGTPALPAPYTGWTPATTVGVTSVPNVNLNGPNGIAGPLNYFSSPPVLRVAATAGQPIANTTLTQVAFNGAAATVDSYGGWSPPTGQYTVQRDGLYLHHSLVAFAANTTASRRAGVTVNGTTYWGPPSPAPAAGTANVSKTQVLSLKAGDVVSLACRQDSGSTLNLATTDQTRMLLVWLGEEGLPAGNWSPPDTSFRWAAGTQGEGLGGDLSALLQAHLANDLGFLANRPYLLAYQTVAQTGLPTGAFSTVTLDTVGSPIHGTDVGDNYSGWAAGAANNYEVQQQPGWYLEVGEFFTAAAATSTATVTAGLSVPTSGGYAPSKPTDYYQALAATTTAGTGGGATVLAVHYLAAGETVTPQVMAAGAGYGPTYATQVGLQGGGWWYPHFEVVWLSD